MADNSASDPKRRNRVMAMGLLAVVVLMVGVSYAAVPLYQLFCQVTGFGGTTQVGSQVPDRVLDRTMRIRMTADVGRGLPWRFTAETREIELKVGEPGLVYYKAENLSDRPVAGTAVYNVNPNKAGLYFVKVQCFCFDEQELGPGEEMAMGVSFFVDPAILEDPRFRDMHTITLSYTFFRDLDDWEAEQGEQQVSDKKPVLTGYRQEQRAAR